MKRIVCELCDCTEFTKEGGFFVCHGCGTRYSLEEARSMMREVKGGAAAPAPAASVVSVSVGAPAVPTNQQQIDNLMLLATNASEAGNQQETENCCNRIIELDATNCRAWFLKGKAVGWASTLANVRAVEAAHSFCKAIEYAPTNEQGEFRRQAIDELERVGYALINLRTQNFVELQTAPNAAGFGSDCSVMLDAFRVLLCKTLTMGDIPEFRKTMAANVFAAATTALGNLRIWWRNQQLPGQFELTSYIERMGYIEIVIQAAIDMTSDLEKKISYCDELITVKKEPMDKCSYKQEWSILYECFQWVKDLSLSQEAISSRNSDVRKINAEIARLRQQRSEELAAARQAAQEARRRRIEEYWNEHADEKARLNQESSDLKAQIEADHKRIVKLLKQLDEIKQDVNSKMSSAETEYELLTNRVEQLTASSRALPFYALREKRQMDAEIKEIVDRIENLRKQVNGALEMKRLQIEEKSAPLNQQIKELSDKFKKAESRISAINTELTRDR